MINSNENKKVPLAIGVLNHVGAMPLFVGSIVQGFSLILFFLFTFGTLSASSQSELYASQLIDLYAIAQIESSNNPNAFNPISKATGLYQITPICLKDFNLNARRGTFSLSDMKDPAKAKIVASWYLFERLPGLIQHLGEEVNVDTILIGYNCGPGCLKRSKLPPETQNYLTKYRRLTT